jgi:hypothetical protein
MGLKDDMWRLEAKGMESDVKERELASTRQQNIMFVRGETQVNYLQRLYFSSLFPLLILDRTYGQSAG